MLEHGQKSLVQCAGEADLQQEEGPCAGWFMACTECVSCSYPLLMQTLPSPLLSVLSAHISPSLSLISLHLFAFPFRFFLIVSLVQCLLPISSPLWGETKQENKGDLLSGSVSPFLLKHHYCQCHHTICCIHQPFTPTTQFTNSLKAPHEKPHTAEHNKSQQYAKLLIINKNKVQKYALAHANDIQRTCT